MDTDNSMVKVRGGEEGVLGGDGQRGREMRDTCNRVNSKKTNFHSSKKYPDTSKVYQHIFI